MVALWPQQQKFDNRRNIVFFFFLESVAIRYILSCCCGKCGHPAKCKRRYNLSAEAEMQHFWDRADEAPKHCLSSIQTGIL